MQTTLVTSFQPFQGRGKNGSTTLLRWLRRRWEKGRYVSRILPVDWKRAPLTFSQLEKRHRPWRILGLGEGRPGRVAWETVARNELAGTDEAGVIISAGVIEENAAPTLSSTWPWPANLSETSLFPKHLEWVLSEDAGAFLCNRLLWAGLRSSASQVGFLHLPPQGEMDDPEYAKMLGPLVLALLG